jgi:FixJ family two-component response regulator
MKFTIQAMLKQDSQKARAVQARFKTLTSRERDVLTSCLEEPGLTIEGRAEHLGISKHTMARHLEKIYKKVGVIKVEEMISVYLESKAIGLFCEMLSGR